MALEHCIAPFLDSCDRDNDHKITLIEWGKCLELNEVTIPDIYKWIILSYSLVISINYKVIYNIS